MAAKAHIDIHKNSCAIRVQNIERGYNMKLSEGFTELTQEEQEIVAGGGLISSIGGIFTSLYRGLGALLGLNTKNNIKDITTIIINTINNLPPELLSQETTCQSQK